jgi:hypothetical protein
MREISRDIFSWATAHPEWRPTAEAVVSYALVEGRTVSLVDPLLPPDGSPQLATVLAALDRLVDGADRLDLMITIPYHTRSAEPLYEHYRGRLRTQIWGHRAIARRLRAGTPFNEIHGGDEVGSEAVAHAIGNPRRYETPLYFPDHKALVFGDAVVGVKGRLRVWEQSRTKPGWYEERFLPTLTPLLDLALERVLVTHGPPVLKGGRAELRAALASPPVRDFLT